MKGVGIAERLKFLGEFIRSPLTVGSPLATSDRTIHKLLGGVRWDAVECFVEFGPGTGEFTRCILSQAPQTARVYVIESDPNLAAHLMTIEDARLTVCNTSATEVLDVAKREGIRKANYVLSGIPFSTLRESEREKVVEDAASLLTPQGQFLVYQVRRSIEGCLHKYFENVRRRRVWMNMPPYYLYWCSKPRAPVNSQQLATR